MNNTDENIFMNFQKILSYNALLSFILAERGVGKSFGSKLYVAKRFLKTGKQFVYIRRYKTELKEAMMKKGNPIFFDQIKKDPAVKDHKLTNTNDTMSIDGKVCGYAIPLSIANILKSATYEGVDTIIFDEFIIDKGHYHYLQNEVIQMLDVIETISRLRDIRVLFLANSISITNPYFTFFNLTLPYNSEYKTFKDGLILVYYGKNLKYREVKKATRFGKLIDGTEYGKYAIDNEFLRDSKSFIKKKTKNCKFYFILVIQNKKFGIWCDYKEGYMFISNDYETTLLIRCRTSPFFKSIIEHYRLARLCFESQQIKNVVMNEIVKFITY